MKNFVHGLLLSALLATAGGPSAAVQAVAWTTMFFRFSREDSFLVSVQRTFSGQEPCRFCLKADELRDQEAPDSPGRLPLPEKFPDLFVAELAEVPLPVPGEVVVHPDGNLTPESRSDVPLLGPPERA